MALAPPQNPEEEAQALEALKYRWKLRARPSQLPPDTDWRIWLIKTGRGWGKTRTAGEWVRDQVQAGKCGRLHLVARTAADVRDTMVEGESGIMAISPPSFEPKYKPSIRRLEWPNGATATTFSAEEPDMLRGPQCDGWWADEVAAWKYAQDAWDQLQFGARLGNPRGIVTTTPRPVALIKALIKESQPTEDGSAPRVHVTHGHTLENAANLAPAYLERIKERYEGTRLGRQELAGEMLDDNPHALWRRDWIDRDRLVAILKDDGMLDLNKSVLKDASVVRIVVGLDPSATSMGDEAGIVVAAKDNRQPAHYYVLDDLSIQGSPETWAKRAVTALHKHDADRIIYESNMGGEMIPAVLKIIDPLVRLQSVYASRGKAIRAEPISALYEQGRVHHIGTFSQLEDEQCEWEPGAGDSPNHMDALVWAITALDKLLAPGGSNLELLRT